MCKRIHGREERILRAVIPKSRAAIYLSSAIPNDGYSIIDSNFHSRRIFAIRCIRNFPPINHARCTIVFYLTTFIPLALNVKHVVPLLMYLSFEIIFALYMYTFFLVIFQKLIFIISLSRDIEIKREKEREVDWKKAITIFLRQSECKSTHVAASTKRIQFPSDFRADELMLFEPNLRTRCRFYRS